MLVARELPLPPHFVPAHADRWDYRPDLQALFTESLTWRREHAILSAATASRDVHLLLIDLQKDFCFPQGTLYVGGQSGQGALDDNRRLAAFIYRYLHLIKNITVTMDTHHAQQIFFAPFWVDSDNQPLAPHTLLTTEVVRRGGVRPNPHLTWWLSPGNPEDLLRQVTFYCAELERAGKYTLYLWPPHCILGSEGHALAGVIHEAQMFHAYTRSTQSWVELKGTHPLTESYSVLGPEVLSRYDGTPLAQKNRALLDRLLQADAILIAGQAASHCVKSSIEDLLTAIEATNPDLAQKVYLLTDCMSSVVVPDGQGGFAVDFTPQTEQALQRFAIAGMHLVHSTDPLATWPGWPC